MQPMKLYTTLTSPYARVVKILILEKGLSDHIEFVPAKTRSIDSPYYDINVSGRVPFLINENGLQLEDSHEICAYLDGLDGQRQFVDSEVDVNGNLSDEDWQSRQLQARATSLIDGVSVWIREIRRKPEHQSPVIIEHEKARALRLTGWWELQVNHQKLQGPLNLLQATLYCALDLDNSIDAFRWREHHPGLAEFMRRLEKLPAINQSSPW